MTINFNTNLPSYSVNQQQSSTITKENLLVILKAWANNPSTNVSKADAKVIADAIYKFYVIETNDKCTALRGQPLQITGVEAKSFPEIFSYPPFTKISHLTLKMNLSDFPKSICDLNQLHTLDLSDNHLEDLPENLHQIPSLTDLNLSSNKFSRIPKCLTQMSQLKTLNLRQNNLSYLPKDISQWKELKRLDLGENEFANWPKSLETISNQAVVILDENFSAWKTAKILSKIERPTYGGPQIQGLNSYDSSDSDCSSDSDYEELDTHRVIDTMAYDKIEIPTNSSTAERIRKRKSEKFLEQSELARKVLKRNPPSIIADEFGSSYNIFGSVKDKPIGVYKPRLQVMRAHVDYDSDNDGEIAGIPTGTEAFRERLAYALNYELSQLLDENNIPLVDLGIPPTRVMDFYHKSFGRFHRTGSLQKFKKNCVEFSSSTKEELEKVDRNELFKVAIVDLIFLNKDRRIENLLYSEAKDKINLIDHGYCFPEIEGLSGFDFSWKELSFIHEPLPENWANFIRQIDLRKIVNRVTQEMDVHMKKFPKEDMEISGEALFVMLYAIESLKKFVRTNESTASISLYLDHILCKSNICYAEIKDPISNNIQYVELPNEFPLFYINSSSKKTFQQDSFDNMGFNPIFGTRQPPTRGELKLKEMCEQYGFENVTLYQKDFLESEFSKQIQEAFNEYEKDKDQISVRYIHQNLDETQEYISSCLAKYPMSSFSEYLKAYESQIDKTS